MLSHLISSSRHARRFSADEIKEEKEGNSREEMDEIEDKEVVEEVEVEVLLVVRDFSEISSNFPEEKRISLIHCEWPLVPRLKSRKDSS